MKRYDLLTCGGLAFILAAEVRDTEVHAAVYAISGVISGEPGIDFDDPVSGDRYELELTPDLKCVTHVTGVRRLFKILSKVCKDAPEDIT